MSYCGMVDWLLQNMPKKTFGYQNRLRLGKYRQSPDESPLHIEERLVTPMGRLKNAEELKAQFIYGSSRGAQATLKSLGQTVFSSWVIFCPALKMETSKKGLCRRGEPRTRTLANVMQLNPIFPSGHQVLGEEEFAEDELHVTQQILSLEERSGITIVCFLCYREGHIVIDCDIFPATQLKLLLERHTKFLQKRRRQDGSVWSRTSDRIPRRFSLEGTTRGEPDSTRKN